jgi:hypothetical protein
MNLLTICLYEAVQVPIMNLSVPPEESNFWIGLARIAGTAFFGLIAVEAIRKLFHRSFDELKLYFRTRPTGCRHRQGGRAARQTGDCAGKG